MRSQLSRSISPNLPQSKNGVKGCLLIDLTLLKKVRKQTWTFFHMEFFCLLHSHCLVSNVNIQWFMETFVTSQFTRSNAGEKVPYMYQNIIFASQVNCMGQ